MFGLGTGLLIKIAIAVILLWGGYWAVTSHFKNVRETQQALGAANERIAELEADLAFQEDTVLELNNRIIARNKETLKEIAAAEAAQVLAQEEAKAAKAAKKIADTNMKEAQRKYKEILDHDEDLQTYEDTIIPDAVLDRLRSANGETWTDTVRTGRDSSTDFQTASSGTVAGMSVPPVASEWQQECRANSVAGDLRSISLAMR